MWWLILSAALPCMVFAILGCGSDRKDVKKAEHSKRTVKSKKGGVSSKTTHSSKSRKPGHKSSSKSRKSSKSRSGKSKSGKSKSGKSKSGKKVKVAQMKSKSGRSAKKTKTVSSSEDASAKIKSSTSVAAVPNIVELRAEPGQMSFKKTGELQTFKFINNSNESRAFKVKCSDNQMYRVTPVFGIVQPHGSTTIDILRQNGAAKVEKLVLLTAPVDASTSEKEYKQLLATPGNCQMTIVPLLVEA